MGYRNIQWDLTSNLVAVEMRASKEEKGVPASDCALMVQVYYRDSYHWYLKLRWPGWV